MGLARLSSIDPRSRGGNNGSGAALPQPLSRASALCLLLCLTGVQAQDGPGLLQSPQEADWSHWNARTAPQNDTQGQVRSMGLLGDYLFTAAPQGATANGLRATGGVVWGTPSTRMASSESPATAQPLRSDAQRFWGGSRPDGRTTAYFGLGYTRANLKQTGWRLNADLGVAWRMTPGSSSVKLGAADSNAPLEDVLRDARLAPLMHLSVSYSF